MKVCVLINSNTGFCSREISGLMMIDRHVGIMNLLIVRRHCLCKAKQSLKYRIAVTAVAVFAFNLWFKKKKANQHIFQNAQVILYFVPVSIFFLYSIYIAVMDSEKWKQTNPEWCSPTQRGCVGRGQNVSARDWNPERGAPHAGQCRGKHSLISAGTVPVHCIDGRCRSSTYKGTK